MKSTTPTLSLPEARRLAIASQGFGPRPATPSVAHVRQLAARLHAYLRDSRVPLLAVWGRNDEIFRPEGALAFADDAPGAEICLLDGGHFLLESHLDAAAGCIRRFLDRALT